MTVVAGTGDVVSRIVLQVRASVGDVWTSAATIWEAGFDGVTPFGRIVLAAAQTLITTGGGDVLALFDEDGLHLANAFIDNLTGDQINFNTLTGNHIVVGSIDSPSLAFEAVTEYADLAWYESHSGGGNSSQAEQTKVTRTLNNPAGNPVLLIVNLDINVSISGSGGAGGFLKLKRNGTILYNQTEAIAPYNLIIYDAAGLTAPVYTITTQWGWTVGGGSSAFIELRSQSGVLFWKR